MIVKKNGKDYDVFTADPDIILLDPENTEDESTDLIFKDGYIKLEYQGKQNFHRVCKDEDGELGLEYDDDGITNYIADHLEDFVLKNINKFVLNGKQ